MARRRSILDPMRGGTPLALVLALLALAGCGERKESAAPQPPEKSEAELLASGYLKMNGYLVPPREVPDPTIPDSCALLTEANPGPKELIAEPLAPIERMTNVCIAKPASQPGYDDMIAVEVRHPEPLEIEAGGVPKDLESYWVAEGGGIDLMGGRKEQVEQIPGLGDFAVWYVIGGGHGLQAYAQGHHIVRITIRGVEMKDSQAWAKAVAQRALESCIALDNKAGQAAQ